MLGSHVNYFNLKKGGLGVDLYRLGDAVMGQGGADLDALCGP